MSSIIYNEVFENLVAHKPVSYIYDTPLIERKMNDTLEMMFNLGEDGFSILIEEPSSSEYTKPSFVDIIHIGGAVSHYKVNLMSLKDAFECNAWLLDVSGQKKETHVLSLVGPLIQMHVEQIEDDGYEIGCDTDRCVCLSFIDISRDSKCSWWLFWWICDTYSTRF